MKFNTIFVARDELKQNKQFFKRLLQYGYINNRIVVGDFLGYADLDFLRNVCHVHYSLNHLLPPERILTNLRARAGHPFQLPEYTTLLHKKAFIVRVL